MIRMPFFSQSQRKKGEEPMKRLICFLIVLLLFASACAAEGDNAEAKEPILTRFFYTHGGYMRPQTYEIVWGEDGYELTEDDEEPRRIDGGWVAEIVRVVREYDLMAWDGFRESNPYILDGESFFLELAFSDGAAVSASGDNAFPDGYSDATGRIEEILQREKMARIAGTYRYEGEGFGGDFTLTLNADGTYTFYEGAFSSYMGGGTWDIYWNAIDMTEQNGLELRFMLGYAGDTLLYLAAGSDSFPYVQVPDMGKFIRTAPEPPAETDEPVIRRTDGEEVPLSAITEFYYTYESSTFPPDYQRYRFFTQDGAYFFAHETRAGDHFPLGEEDVTVSGKLALTEEDWRCFLICLDGGAVKPREESLEDGDAGPWLYLYWQGDRGVEQEFSFASRADLTAFEAYCEEMRNREMKRMEAEAP